MKYLFCLSILFFAANGAALSQDLNPAAGAGIMVSGELWDSFMPPNVGSSYREPRAGFGSRLLRVGNFGRTWAEPTHMWPGGWTNGNYWGKDIWLMEFNPDTSWNPRTISGVTNPSFYESSGAQYSFGSFKSTLAGATDLSRNYKREARWVDPVSRRHAVYEAGWPTTIGVDVKVSVHQFTQNWNNFNDFILVVITLTNTGNLDMNADGVVERTGNNIRALTLLANGEFMGSYALTRGAGRLNRFGATRAVGYLGDRDAKGSPWDIMVGFPGESGTNLKDMGLNDFPLRFYSDVWSGWSWLGVKRGSATADSLFLLPDKSTIYGSHPIGTGAERGWYSSAGIGRGRGMCQENCGTPEPKAYHTLAMSTWYKDGGRTLTSSDLSPNPNYFAAGAVGVPTSFVPKANPSRPNGDRKLLSEESTAAFDVNSYEPGWSKGFTARDNFDGDMLSGVGPFSLQVGESITVAWAEAGGFRMQGIQNAIAAARWAFEHGLAVPEAPATPDVKVINPSTTSARVYWDSRAETHPRFAGYKVYSASTGRLFNSTEGGMRRLDTYWKSTVPFSVAESLMQPINPNFAANSFVSKTFGVPDTWGPYELVAVIPKENLVRYRDESEPGYAYSFHDNSAILGFKYWYYVAAYTKEVPAIDLGTTYNGLNSPITSTLETSNINRNGASGMWVDTYPFADLNPFYPQTSEGLKAIGAGLVIKSVLSDPKSLANGSTKISVRPNPYKKKAFFDSPIDAFDHKVIFYNLPPRAKITILDVSGQLVKEIPFESSDPTNGSVFWNLFSKDGIEVASGLYIYVVEYEGGKHVGYLSILR